MEKLPENWNDMSLQEKKIFFSKYYLNYIREGEAIGLYDWAPEEIKQAYEEMKKEEVK